MFPDLLCEDIQPKRIDVHHLPEIEISDDLKVNIQEMLEEEGNYAHVYGCTTIVQFNKKYVFFSNQWLNLAVLCKKYAEALKYYTDFFDNKIRNNQELLRVVKSENYDSQQFQELVPEETDRDRLIKYIKSDTQFRPGNPLMKGKDLRETKDIFCSCFSKKLDEVDSSTEYIGYLIYYLSKRPELYNSIETEVYQQLGECANILKLPSTVKDCAKYIVDSIYEVDCFERLIERFVVSEQMIKIDTSDTDGLLPKGNWLRSMFIRPSSNMYNPNHVEKKTRVFEKEYSFECEGEAQTCKLTTEWTENDVVEDAPVSNNYLQAIIALVNRYYSDVLKIKKETGAYYLYFLKNEFVISKLPNAFDSSFSRRYITSLLAKPFVILTGNSGTGKTRISKQFAEYLEVENKPGEKNWMLVPVGADWTDNTRILGFFNPLSSSGKGEYVKTEIVKLIERANKNRDIPYFLILDEMNLSHVERYFSDFLSHMETPDIPFELDGYVDVDDTERTSGKLEYPKNLFVVGTVNIDETTYMFSPKVLDRANVIEFKPDKNDVLKLFGISEKNTRITPAAPGVAEAFLSLSKEIRNGKQNVEKEQISEINRVFQSVYDILEKNGYEFAYRTVSEIGQYINAACELSNQWDISELFRSIDEQLLQKVLPKIHGNKKEIGSMLNEMEALCLEKNLVLSKKKIEQMKGKLDTVQYASFI